MSGLTHNPIDQNRRTASSQLDPQRRSQLGQFMTPSPIADFMVSLFQNWPSKITLLDPGAGVGSLSDSFAREFFERVDKGNLSISTFEIEPILIQHLSDNLKLLEIEGRKRQTKVNTKVHKEDFILSAVESIKNKKNLFSHAILNPPYKKIAANSEHRSLLRSVGLEVGNLYAAFLALAISMTEKDGEVVAIIPRSFCNGLYFRPFREWLFQNASLTQIHIFESRVKAFQDDDVLQENVIMHFRKNTKQGKVIVSSSHDATFDNLKSFEVEFKKIVDPSDSEHFIRIPTSSKDSVYPFSHKLSDLELTVSTGPVVDFRVREFLSDEDVKGSMPLIYPHNFTNGNLIWPRKHKKPNSIRVTPTTSKLLMPKGWYIVIRRLTSKEEKKRIVASIIDPENLPFKQYAFENHLNVIHSAKNGLDPAIARGLAVFLNSTIIDQYFRTFNGHTQVNATDLRAICFPDRKALEALGRKAPDLNQLDQQDIDKLVTAYA